MLIDPRKGIRAIKSAQKVSAPDKRPYDAELDAFERRMADDVSAELSTLQRSVVRGVSANTVSQIPQRVSNPQNWQGVRDTIAANLQRVALFGSDIGRQQIEKEVFGVKGVKREIALNVWELANNAAIEWALRQADNLALSLQQVTTPRIQRLIADWIANSEPIGTLFDRIAEGYLYSQDRAESIAVTEVTRAFAAGNQAAWEKSTVVEGKRWETNRDELVCPICRPLYHKVVGLGAQFDNGLDYPPAHPRCILPDNLVSIAGRVEAATKSFYDGLAIEIRLSDGRVLSVTPNHPILTPSGWVSAGKLRKNGYVLGSADCERVSSSIDPNNYNVPTRAKEIFNTLKVSPFVFSASVPSTPKDFHNDGNSVEGNIDIVYVDSFLGSEWDASTDEHSPQSFLGSRDIGHSTLLPNGLLDLDSVGQCNSCGGVMSSGNLGLPPFRSHHRPLDRFGSRPIAQADPLALQSRGDGISTDSPLLAQGVNRLASTITLDKFRQSIYDFSLESDTASVDALLLQESGNGLAANAPLASQFTDRFASLITPYEIVSIREFDFSGHVYDFQVSPYELFFTSGIITHNCRCWIVPVVQI